jgi:antitoxin YefM
METKMVSVSLEQARQHFDDVIARVLADAEPAVVSTASGESVVVIPLDDFEAWKETAYLLRNPENAAHLLRSIAEANAGNIQPRPLAD